MPLGHGRTPVFDQDTGEDLPLSHGGPPPPQQPVPLEQLVHLPQVQGLDADGGRGERPQLQVPCRGRLGPICLLPGVSWFTCKLKETPVPEENVKVLGENPKVKTLSLAITKDAPEVKTPGITIIKKTPSWGRPRRRPPPSRGRRPRHRERPAASRPASLDPAVNPAGPQKPGGQKLAAAPPLAPALFPARNGREGERSSSG